MKNAIVKGLGMLALALSIGWVSGCDIPDEKKSVFQKAHTTQPDSARPTEQKTQSDEKREMKKPRAFSVRDNVNV